MLRILLFFPASSLVGIDRICRLFTLNLFCETMKTDILVNSSHTRNLHKSYHRLWFWIFNKIELLVSNIILLAMFASFCMIIWNIPVLVPYLASLYQKKIFETCQDAVCVWNILWSLKFRSLWSQEFFSSDMRGNLRKYPHLCDARARPPGQQQHVRLLRQSLAQLLGPQVGTGTRVVGTVTKTRPVFYDLVRIKWTKNNHFRTNQVTIRTIYGIAIAFFIVGFPCCCFSVPVQVKT